MKVFQTTCMSNRLLGCNYLVICYNRDLGFHSKSLNISIKKIQPIYDGDDSVCISKAIVSISLPLFRNVDIVQNVQYSC